MSVSSIGTHRKTEKEMQFADGRGDKGVGEEPCMLLYKSFNTLWGQANVKPQKKVMFFSFSCAVL
jgi:hypothetical protein